MRSVRRPARARTIFYTTIQRDAYLAVIIVGGKTRVTTDIIMDTALTVLGRSSCPRSAADFA
jgi:hypothetical protein